MKPYPKYKDSGIEWLGNIPEKWEAIRLRFCLKLNPSKQEIKHLSRDTELSFIPMEAVGEDGSLDLSTTCLIKDVENGYTFFRNYDVAIAKITPCFENGKGCIFRNLIHEYGFGTTELTVMRPKLLVPEFLFYLTISHHFRINGIGLMQGSAGQKRVPNDFIRDYIIGIPSEKEQQAIAAFLDRETARIDALIQKKKRMIELLKEKRIALITQAVTKGLDPNTKMNDSGIQWLGEVPEHWEVKNLGRVSTSIKNGTTADQESYSNDNYRVTRIETISKGVINYDKTGLVDYSPSLDKYRLHKGDILFSHINSMEYVGNCALYEISETLYSGMNLLRIIPDKCVSPRFLLYWLKSTGMKFEIQRNSKPAINQVSIPIGYVKSLPVVMPPLKEQHAITEYIKREVTQIDHMSSRVNQSLTLLREYRSSLIHSAVTGKIDLRDTYEEL